ncbi:HIRAN domain-containing protein [Sphingomonas sp. PL-96]|uniref:HIRAN domain-containing protein n=1 Tax=Sphingomonas sp. PL-96 TaxID=2887201 RepID=UPI001E335A15|nr:HIRAN domain-containing protein [Sphingomonas sp. PL-96]MCC2977981.1 HIRAN domain-containing protein [Sphingomonas sp. PL-96]
MPWARRIRRYSGPRSGANADRAAAAPAAARWWHGSAPPDKLRRCEPGEIVDLVREPQNPHDHMPVAVISARGVCVGYLRSD